MNSTLSSSISSFQSFRNLFSSVRDKLPATASDVSDCCPLPAERKKKNIKRWLKALRKCKFPHEQTITKALDESVSDGIPQPEPLSSETDRLISEIFESYLSLSPIGDKIQTAVPTGSEQKNSQKLTTSSGSLESEESRTQYTAHFEPFPPLGPKKLSRLKKLGAWVQKNEGGILRPLNANYNFGTERQSKWNMEWLQRYEKADIRTRKAFDENLC